MFPCLSTISVANRYLLYLRKLTSTLQLWCIFVIQTDIHICRFNFLLLTLPQYSSEHILIKEIKYTSCLNIVEEKWLGYYIEYIDQLMFCIPGSSYSETHMTFHFLKRLSDYLFIVSVAKKELHGTLPIYAVIAVRIIYKT